LGFLFSGVKSVFWVAVAYIIVKYVEVVVVLIVLYRRDFQFVQPSLVQMKQIVAYGLRSLLGNIPEELNTRFDQFLIAILLTPQEVGWYVVSVSWSLLLSGFFRATGMVNFPYIAAETDERERRALFAASARSASLISLVIGGAMLLVTPTGMIILFGQDFVEAIPIAMLLVVAAVFYNYKTLFKFGMQGLGRPEAVAYGEIPSIILNIVLLLLLIPRYGIYGAALASIAAYAVALLILLLLAYRWLGLSFRDLLIPRRSDIQAVTRRIRWQLANFRGNTS
jgi:O-antigen/teichoic acid export membrane protein